MFWRLFKYRLTLLKLKAIRNSVPESHKPHFKWSDKEHFHHSRNFSWAALILVFKIFNVLKVFSRK